jgi:hypothetical protein
MPPQRTWKGDEKDKRRYFAYGQEVIAVERTVLPSLLLFA